MDLTFRLFNPRCIHTLQRRVLNRLRPPFLQHFTVCSITCSRAEDNITTDASVYLCHLVVILSSLRAGNGLEKVVIRHNICKLD